MAKMRWGADGDEPDWGALEDAEYNEDGDFKPYDGPLPPKGTLLTGEIKKVWAVTSSNGNQMFKCLWEAVGNTGDKEKYNGLAIWENVVWTEAAKFKWQAWLDSLSLTLKMVRQATITAEEKDKVGMPVLRIHKLRFPATVRVLTDKDKYNDTERATVNKWIAPADEEEDFDDEEDGDEPPF